MNSIALLGLLLLAHSTNTFVLDLSLKHKNGFAGRVDPILSSSSLLSESSQRGEAHSDLRQRLDELAGSGKGADDLEKEVSLVICCVCKGHNEGTTRAQRGHTLGTHSASHSLCTLARTLIYSGSHSSLHAHTSLTNMTNLAFVPPLFTSTPSFPPHPFCPPARPESNPIKVSGAGEEHPLLHPEQRGSQSSEH